MDYGNRDTRYSREAVLVTGKVVSEQKLTSEDMARDEIQSELLRLAEKATRDSPTNTFQVKPYSYEAQIQSSAVVRPGIWLVDFCNKT